MTTVALLLKSPRSKEKRNDETQTRETPSEESEASLERRLFQDAQLPPKCDHEAPQNTLERGSTSPSIRDPGALHALL